MQHLDLILLLTGGLATALVLGYITQWIGLSPIVGYLLAGIVVGPSTPGFDANRELAQQCADIGIIFLMFGVGLHFHMRDLLSVRRIAVPGAIGQIVVTTSLGLLVGVINGWGWSGGLVFGLTVSVASTVVLFRVLADNNELHTPTGRVAIGWLIVEDLVTVLVLVLLPVVSKAEVGPGGVLLAVVWSMAKVVLLATFLMIGGGRAIPRVLAHVSATRSRELFTLTILVLALGIAVGASQLFGVSMALGAFLAGMVVGQSDFSSRAASEAMPMGDAFAVLFFVSVGMLFKPGILFESPFLVATILGIILIGKPLTAFALCVAMRSPIRIGISVALALAQIGEFSFILASLGRELGILSEQAASAVIAAAIASISLNSIVYQLRNRIERIATRFPGAWQNPSLRDTIDLADSSEGEAFRHGRAIVVGYGPVGRTLVQLLRDNEIEPTVIELNHDTVQRLRADGVRAVYGDASHLETLKEAGAPGAIALILSSAGMRNAVEAIRLAREISPRIRVFARSDHLREVPALRRHGAEVVFSGEGEVALAMNEFLMRSLGASSEQVDRVRDRVRNELFGNPLVIEILLPPPPPPAQEAPPTEPTKSHSPNPTERP